MRFMVSFGPLFATLLRAYVAEGFVRPLRVSEPCKGIGGFREMAEMGGLRYQSVNAMDVDSRYKEFYEKLGRQTGVQYPIGMFGENWT